MARALLGLVLLSSLLPGQSAEQIAAPPSVDAVARVEAIRGLRVNEFQAQARTYFLSLNAREVDAVRLYLETEATSPSTTTLWSLLMERWGELDGPAAFAYAASQQRRSISIQSRALVGWARRDARAAWSATMAASQQGVDRRYSSQSVLAVIAERDMPYALSGYLELPEDRACLECHAGTLMQLAIEHGQAAEIAGALARLPDGPHRNTLRDLLWEQLGDYSPDLGLALLSTLPTADRLPAEARLCTGWARHDFKSAIQYILHEANRSHFEALIVPSVQSWSRDAVADDIAMVVEQLPTDLTERALLGVIPTLAALDPKTTLAWSLRSPTEAVREEAAHRVMIVWTRNNGEGALQAVRSEKDPGLKKTLLWAYLLSRLQNNTLNPADYREIEEGFDPGWLARLLEKMALMMNDPARKISPAIDRQAFARVVEEHPLLTAKHKETILGTLQGKGG